MNREEQLLAYLKGACTGRAHRASGADLERALHASGAALRKHVSCLRRRGVPIASDRYGYFYAQTAGEVYATIQLLRKIVRGLEAVIQGLEHSLDGFPVGR